MEKLKFGIGGNAKLEKNIATFSLISGYSCPGADKCYTKVVVDDDGKRKIIDGKNQEFRCFSASQEVLYKNVYNSRKHNYDIILDIVKNKELSFKEKVDTIYNLLKISLPDVKKWDILRLHVGGDIFCLEYLDALIKLANDFPHKIFYAYTKSIHLWIKRLDKIPTNFKLTASYGGKYDNLIDEYNLKNVRVVLSEEEAEMWNLEIDHDDTHAFNKEDNFALLIHGGQQKGSDASKAKSELSKKGWNGYTNVKSKVKNMLNLKQNILLKYYLVELGLQLNLIKDAKQITNRLSYISFKNQDVIYSDVPIIDGITFLYNDSVYNCYKFMLPGTNIVKWLCNCDVEYKDIYIYNDKSVVVEENKKPEVINDKVFEISDEVYNDIIKNYYWFEGVDTIEFRKIYEIDNILFVYNETKGHLEELNENNYKTLSYLKDSFEQAFRDKNIISNYFASKLANSYSNYSIVRIKHGSIEGINLLKEPLYNIKDILKVKDKNETIIVRSIIFVDNQWIYVDKNSKKEYFEYELEKSGVREIKDDKLRPDLISPYFIEALGKLLQENNKKYAGYNYMLLPENSFYESMMRHVTAYSQQRLYGTTPNFDNAEDHLAAIAFNVMGLLHIREVKNV